MEAGSWPLLKCLSISGDFGLKLFVQLAASSWPLLETIQTSCNYCAPQAISLAGCWRNVKNLQIMTCDPSQFGSFSMPAVSGLTDTEWTNLQALDLCYSDLGPSGFTQLAQGQWPLLGKLNLSQSQRYVFTPLDYANFAMGS